MRGFTVHGPASISPEYIVILQSRSSYLLLQIILFCHTGIDNTTLRSKWKIQFSPTGTVPFSGERNKARTWESWIPPDDMLKS